MNFEILTPRQCIKIKGCADLPVITDVSEFLKPPYQVKKKGKI
jgi:hypothetical protein